MREIVAAIRRAFGFDPPLGHAERQDVTDRLTDQEMRVRAIDAYVEAIRPARERRRRVIPRNPGRRTGDV